MAKENTAITKMKQVQEETVNNVLARVVEFQTNGQLTLPKDFSPENALKAAWFTLLETKTRDKKPVLEACTNGSITNALFEMILQGLNPMKKQCAFIAYGDQLQMQREYHGTIALAKRFGGVKEANGHVIYNDDVFEYTLDINTGRKTIIKHEQKLENIGKNKIKGAYAVLTLNDGSIYVDVMNMEEIKDAWNQGPMKGKSPAHTNFPGEMCKKTVISRACKLFISSSDDGSIIDLNKEDVEIPIVPPDANVKTLDIDSEDVTEKGEVKGKVVPIKKEVEIPKKEKIPEPKETKKPEEKGQTKAEF